MLNGSSNSLVIVVGSRLTENERTSNNKDFNWLIMFNPDDMSINYKNNIFEDVHLIDINPISNT